MRRRNAWRSGGVRLVLASLLALGFCTGAASGSTRSVTAVKGSSYGYYASISLFGGPYNTTGPTPTVALTSNASNSPQAATAPTGSVTLGPARFFSSGQIDVATFGSIGANGSTASSTSIRNVNTSGQEVFTAGRVTSNCTASASGVSGSAAITNGTLQTDSGDDDPSNSIPDHAPTTAPIPTNPDPNTPFDGHIHVGSSTDNFRFVFNERAVNSDGSITINAVHEYFQGPTAVGDVIIGQVICGVTAPK